MHVAVFADFEGAFGIWRMRQCRTGAREWQYGRQCLTADVNAAVDGAFSGGAAAVTVKDTHDTGFNCLPRLLDRRARYVGGHYFRPTLFGDIGRYDLVLYVGIHAAAGTPDAFFAHTHYGIFSQFRLNGRTASEMDVYGGYLGEHGVPIGLVSGEDIAVRQAQASMPWALGVEVDKRRETYFAGTPSERYLREGRERLRRTAAAAAAGAAGMKPLKWAPPLRFEVDFRDEATAVRQNTWGFPRRGVTVSWDAADMIEGFVKLNQLTFFPKKYAPVLRPAYFFLRNYHRLRNNWFAPQANSEGAATAG